MQSTFSLSLITNQTLKKILHFFNDTSQVSSKHLKRNTQILIFQKEKNPTSHFLPSTHFRASKQLHSKTWFYLFLAWFCYCAWFGVAATHKKNSVLAWWVGKHIYFIDLWILRFRERRTMSAWRNLYGLLGKHGLDERWSSFIVVEKLLFTYQKQDVFMRGWSRSTSNTSIFKRSFKKVTFSWRRLTMQTIQYVKQTSSKHLNLIAMCHTWCPLRLIRAELNLKIENKDNFDWFGNQHPGNLSPLSQINMQEI